MPCQSLVQQSTLAKIALYVSAIRPATTTAGVIGLLGSVLASSSVPGRGAFEWRYATVRPPGAADRACSSVKPKLPWVIHMSSAEVSQKKKQLPAQPCHLIDSVRECALGMSDAYPSFCTALIHPAGNVCCAYIPSHRIPSHPIGQPTIQL